MQCLGDYDKWMHVLTWLKSMNLNIIFLQETHSQGDTIKSWVDN